MCSLLGITKTRTTLYHPQSDGMVERFNRTLLNMLSTAVNKLGSADTNADLAYRTSAKETTKASPFSLVFGRSYQLMLSSIFPLKLTTAPANIKSTCMSNFSKHIRQFVTTHWRNKAGYMINMRMVPHIMLEIKYGYIVQLSQEDAAGNSIGPGRDRLPLYKSLGTLYTSKQPVIPQTVSRSLQSTQAILPTL